MVQISQKRKLIVILGPTASGKSDLAVEIAKQYNGEVISADSRQVYKDLDIGTGKITEEEMQGIPHHLLDVADPKERFDVTQYKKETTKVLEDIWNKNKTPILCGGTGFYVDTVVYNKSFPNIPKNKELEKELEGLSLEKLQEKLKHLDPNRYRSIDTQNPRRLIRAIEIATALGYVPEITETKPHFETLMIGIQTDKELLNRKIYTRLLSRLKDGMIEEAQHLHDNGLSFERMESLGLEYRYLARFLQNNITKEEMTEQLNTEIKKYAKRQRTWFKRDKNIHWFNLEQKEKIQEKIKGFIQTN